MFEIVNEVESGTVEFRTLKRNAFFLDGDGVLCAKINIEGWNHIEFSEGGSIFFDSLNSMSCVTPVKVKMVVTR